MQFFDFQFEPGEVALVDDDVVSILQAILTGWLGIENGLNLLARIVISGHDAPDL